MSYLFFSPLITFHASTDLFLFASGGKGFWSYSLCSPLVKRFSTVEGLSSESWQRSEPKLQVVSRVPSRHANARGYIEAVISGGARVAVFLAAEAQTS